jgi:DNA-binding NarL/FixJ family response regulator
LRFLADSEVTQQTRDLVQAISTHVSVHLATIGCTPSATGALARLTTRQREVARLVTRGASNATIASILEITTNTVKKHLKDIFAGLEIESRAELAVIADRYLALDLAELASPPHGLQIAWVAPPQAASSAESTE